MMIFDMVVERIALSGMDGKHRRVGSWCDYEIRSGWKRNGTRRYVNVWTKDDGWITVALSRPDGSDQMHDYDITDPSFGEATIEEIIKTIRNWLSGNE